MHIQALRSEMMVGRHHALLEVRQLAQRVARSDLPVNISGETGTGKELLARFIHRKSARSAGPFVTVDCGMLSREMARSELFGYVRGAFTGATETREGLVETARGGTLFLDEVGELDPDLQLHLMRLVQDGQFRRVGDSAMRWAGVRLITATHRNLRQMVREKRFREDLYFRLHVVPLQMPPLRARLSDVPLLIDHFCALHAAKGKPPSFTQAARDALERYDWPGNVRELSNEIARLMVVTDGEQIDVMHLPARLRRSVAAPDVYELPFKEARVENQKQFTREYLHRALLRSKGNVSVAARECGIGRQYFQARMSEIGIQAKQYRRKRREEDLERA